MKTIFEQREEPLAVAKSKKDFNCGRLGITVDDLIHDAYNTILPIKSSLARIPPYFPRCLRFASGHAPFLQRQSIAE